MNSNYINRETSWLEFNSRVLSLAEDDQTPALEKLKFCDIYISNLDEFFMKRVGGLKNQEESKNDFYSIDGLTPTEQLKKIRSKVLLMNESLKSILEKNILPELAQNNITFTNWKNLSTNEKNKLKIYFNQRIFPLLTPLGLDSSHPFPFISNLSKSIGIRLQDKKLKDDTFIRLKIPTTSPTWIKINTRPNGSYKFISIDEIIVGNLSQMFPDKKILETCIFRVTRNSDFEKDDEDTEDLMEHVEETIKERKFAPAVRLEYKATSESWIINFLSLQLGLTDHDLYPMPTSVHYMEFKQIYSLPIANLRFSPWSPIEPHSFDTSKKNIFSLIKRNEKLIHHPYFSFDATVEKFIADSSQDKKVHVIKMTLYRTDHDSRIIDSLITAAENGKHVVVVIELQARFDEKNNILMAQRLEKVGIYVVYGMVGYKTHSKMALVIREEKNGMKAYAHIGTGNYNATTSKIYTDLSYFTSSRKITSEIIEVFNILTGIHTNIKIKNLFLAPTNMRKKFISLIKREIENKKNNLPALIIAKMNSLEDQEIIDYLYEASQNGVQVKLIIRGFCCLRPGIKGMSENIEVISIVGRFLEHSRIYFFQNGAEDINDSKFFIGSADWMYRNLNNRFEIITPIENIKLKKKIFNILQVNLNDYSSCWKLNSTGQYIKRKFKKKNNVMINSSTHHILMQQSTTLSSSSGK